MASTATFRVLKNELLNVLKQMQRVEKSAKKKLSTLEVTIIDNYMQLAIPGIKLDINAATKGSAKFTIRLLYFADIIKAEQDNPRWYCVDVRLVEKFPQVVPTKILKADPITAELTIFKQGRLSIAPVSAAQWLAVQRLRADGPV